MHREIKFVDLDKCIICGQPVIWLLEQEMR